MSAVIESFKVAMMDTGTQPPEQLIADGKIHRFSIEGKANRGWYKLHVDGIPAGCYGDWALGVSHKWRSTNSGRLSHDDLEALRTLAKKQAEERAKAERLAQSKAQAKALFIWNNSHPAPANHPYLLKKGIQSHDLRLWKSALVVPLYDSAGNLKSLEFINADGSKRFLSGGLKKACFYWIGRTKKPEKIMLAEGVATGASLYESFGYPVVICFDAGNLAAVAIEIRKLFPSTEICICADNDLSRVGQAKAKLAALAISASLKIPPVSGMDWNDFLTAKQGDK